jgi:hypothetical protein
LTVIVDGVFLFECETWSLSLSLRSRFSGLLVV